VYLRNDVTTMIGHRLRMAHCLTVFYRRGRVFGDKRSHAGLIDIVDEMGELFFDHDQLLSQPS